MDGATFAIILVLILIIAGAIFIVVRNYQAGEESSPPVEAPRSESQISSPTAAGGDSSWMYPRGELDLISTDARNSCVAAYSLHHLFSKYKGPVVRARRLGDSTSAGREDFYADEKGELRTKSGTTLKKWVAEFDKDAIIGVDIFYDQTGKGRHGAVQNYTSGASLVKRDDGVNEGWMLRFYGLAVIKLSSASRSVPLQDYADFTVCLNAKWEDTDERDWETGLWIGRSGTDSSVRRSAIFIGNYGSSGKYSFIYGGNVDEGKVTSTMSAPKTVEKAPITNFMMIGTKKSSGKTQVKGYINGSGFNTNSSDVAYEGPPVENQLVNEDAMYLGGHVNMTGGSESEPIKGALTDLVFFATPLKSSDFVYMSSFNAKSVEAPKSSKA